MVVYDRSMQVIRKASLDSTYPFVLAAGGFIGMTAAAILTYEKIHLLQNPGQLLGCDLNPVIACGSVINTDQASALGFPNPFIGIAGFAVVLTIGMGLLAGARFNRWFWLGLQAGMLFGALFVHWLIFQSLYRIGALCPYCMVVWAATIPLFFYTTLYNIRHNHIRLKKTYDRLVQFIQRHHGDILVAWYLLIITLIAIRFWYYWNTLL